MTARSHSRRRQNVKAQMARHRARRRAEAGPPTPRRRRDWRQDQEDDHDTV